MFGLKESYRGEENAFDTQYKNLKTVPAISRGGFHFLRLFIVFTDMKIVHKRNLKNFGTIDSVHSNVFLT